jgi:type IV secretory pathway TrbD component
LAELDAYAANDSASQAAFLTGATRKYGAKAGQMTHAIILPIHLWYLDVFGSWYDLDIAG